MSEEQIREAVFSNEELHREFTNALVSFANKMSALNDAYFEAVSEVNDDFNKRIAKLRKEIGYEGDPDILQ